MTTLGKALFLICALSVSGLAGSITYNIEFALGGLVNQTAPNAILPTSGSFTYDSVAGFTSFVVEWDGSTFDLTSAANAPFITGFPSIPNGCNDQASSPAFGFLFTSRTVSGCPLTYEWVADNYPGSAASFDFWGYLPAASDPTLSQLAYGIDSSVSGPTPLDPLSSGGTWTITAQVPEPSPLLMTFSWLGVLYCVKRHSRLS
jgi:hypothetical protein